MSSDFLEPGDPRWTGTLGMARHDIYHTPEYVSVAAGEEGGAPTAFYAQVGDTVLLIPLLLRRLPPELNNSGEYADAVTPYGYGSPIVVAGRAAADSVGAALRQFWRAAVDRRLVTAFIRMHPLLPLPEQALEGMGARLTTHGRTVYVDLGLEESEIWRCTRSDHKRGINKLRRTGYSVLHNEWSGFGDFIDVYHETMDRVGAGEEYRFSDRYFNELRHRLGSNLHLFSVVDSKGETAAAGLFFECDDIIQFHLSGSAGKHRANAPSKLMLDGVRRWGKEVGKSIFHLGGGVGAKEDMLFRFKAGFGGGRGVYRTAELVFDRSAYDQLVRERERHGREPVKDGYFPLYRG